MRYIFLRLWYLYLKFIFKLSYFINKLVFNPSFFTNYNISKVNYFYFLRNNSARSFLFEDKKGNHDLLKFSSISSFFSLVHDKVGGDDIINFIVLLREFGYRTYNSSLKRILIFSYLIAFISKINDSHFKFAGDMDAGLEDTFSALLVPFLCVRTRPL